MTVYIDNKTIEIFAGARVRDVVLKYSQENYQSALSGETVISDKNHNPLDLDGEVSEGQHLYTVYKGKKTGDPE